MVELPKSEFVDVLEDGAYRIAGTRVSLASVAYGVLRGETVEEILADFPAIGSRANLKGAVEFIKANPREVIEYLAQLRRLWEELVHLNEPEVVEKLNKAREERNLNPA